MTDWHKHPTAKGFSRDVLEDPYELASAATPTGRDLDALVAEKVMGWRDISWSHGCPIGTPVEPTQSAWQMSIPNFSTDIAAAWLVVAALVERGHFFHVARYTAAPPGATDKELREAWRATFFRNGGPDTWADSAPLAICRAALAAAVDRGA